MDALKIAAADPIDAQTLALAPCGLLLLDPDLRLRSANAYFLDLVGSAEIGRRFHDYLSVAGRIFVQTRLHPELGLNGHVEEIALDLIRSDGARVPAMLNAVQARDDRGRPGLIRMAIWRAAARRAYEAEVPRARLAAEAGMVAKRDFLANISHEIRTPLNGVIGVAEALRLTPLSTDQQAMVDTIVSSGAILERLVSDVLDLSKAQAGELTLELRETDLGPELEGVVQVARFAAEAKGLSFAFDIAANVRLERLCDSVRVRQVLGNLLSNAVKFTARGRVGLSICEDGEALVFVVEDQGIGFDEAIGDTLFQRFQQADTSITRRFGGSGLGLSICKSLVEQMGGAIQARSRPQEGSRFEVRLPLPVAKASANPDATAAATELPPLRILLVEDNPTNQKVVQLILGPFGVDLTIVEDGAKGLAAWRSKIWDLVLMDMQMPVMDGLTAVREIRQEEKRHVGRERTPIVVLSANAMPHHRQESLASGADLHIAKPITPTSLLQAIAAVTQERARP